jgi:hypothetical protein
MKAILDWLKEYWQVLAGLGGVMGIILTGAVWATKIDTRLAAAEEVIKKGEPYTAKEITRLEGGITKASTQIESGFEKLKKAADEHLVHDEEAYKGLNERMKRLEDDTRVIREKLEVPRPARRKYPNSAISSMLQA